MMTKGEIKAAAPSNGGVHFYQLFPDPVRHFENDDESPHDDDETDEDFAKRCEKFKTGIGTAEIGVVFFDRETMIDLHDEMQEAAYQEKIAVKELRSERSIELDAHVHRVSYATAKHQKAMIALARKGFDLGFGGLRGFDLDGERVEDLSPEKQIGVIIRLGWHIHTLGKILMCQTPSSEQLLPSGP